MKIADLAALITAAFIQESYQEDLAEAARIRAAGCLYCGGVLHSARYPRKPRGIEESLPELGSRESFCCAECRRRNTPSSVRFLGRKVYLALCVVAAAIMRSRGATVPKICAVFGMSSETLRCWTRWWKLPVQSSHWWNMTLAQILPPLECKHFIGGLFDRLLTQAGTVKIAIQKLLTFVSPITVPAKYPS